MTNNIALSQIYVGQIRHRRFTPKNHNFNYRLFMLALDVDETENDDLYRGIFGRSWFNPMRFCQQDYVNQDLTESNMSLKTRITNKVNSLSTKNDIARIVMLVQVRCMGVYFSPANFYFCYDSQGHCSQMLAEVSNTPWNQRHYYLVDLDQKQSTDKDFHVSPFMDLNMAYHWRIKPPEITREQLMIHIENKRPAVGESSQEKVFDATLAMNKQAFSQRNLWRVWMSLPLMTLKVVAAIYWQALRLFLKRIPFVSYQTPKNNNT